MTPIGTIAPPERREVGLMTCVALVTATMVGTGVYTSLGFQLQDLRSGFSILVLWGLGGLISLCGALSYAELSARIPRSGGEYTYLSEIYHPALGFMAACVSLLAGFAAPIALSAMAFGSYLHAAFPECPERLSGVLVVVLITLLHLRSLEMSSLVQNAATALKFLLVAVFVVIGLRAAFLHPQVLSVLLPQSGSFAELARPTSGIALLFVLYAYSGWNATTYLAGEVRSGRRAVGLSLVLGTLAVTLLYIVLNAVFLTAAPADDLRGVLHVGTIAASHLLGEQGGRAMSAIIAIGLLASISAMIWAGPRVTQRVGEDHMLFRFLASTNLRGIPRRAMILQLILGIGLMATGSFESVLVYAQVPLILCLILGVAGVMVLRVKSARSGACAGDDIVCRCPLYPLPLVVFILSTLAGLIYSAVNKPLVALAGVGTMVIPLVLYPLIVRKTSFS